MIKRGFYIFLAFGMAAWAGNYVVRPGDTLSGIAHRYRGGKPVYGPKGSLAEIVRENHIENPHFIVPGLNVQVPAATDIAELDAQTEAVVEANAEETSEFPVTVIEADHVPAPVQVLAPKRKLPPEEGGEWVFVPSAVEDRTPAREVAQESVPDAPVATPAAAAAAPAEIAPRRGLFSIAALTSFSRIDTVDKATNAEASFPSDLNLGLQANWRQAWMPGFRTEVGLGVARTSLRGAPTQTLEESKQTMASLQIGAGWALGRDLWLSLRAGLAQRAFLRPIAANTLRVERVVIPEVEWALEYRFLQFNRFALDADVAARWYAPTEAAGLQATRGYGLGAGLGVSHPFNACSELRATAFFGLQSRPTNTLDQSWKEMGLRIGYHLGF